MVEVSIIIPVYNGEAHIYDMLDSVRKQSFKNYEIIIINDGSTDCTQEIINKFQRRDERIFSLYQDNQGVSVARNLGLDKANGEYIVFYDADDFVPRIALEKMMKTAKSETPDLIVGAMRINRAGDTKITASTNRLSHTPIVSKFDEDLIWSFSVCNKMFKREVIENNNLRFDVGQNISEDGIFVTTFVHMCNKICGCPMVAYEYIKRLLGEEVSLTQNISTHRLKNDIKGMDKLEKIVVNSIENDVKPRFICIGEDQEYECRKYLCLATLYKRFVRSDLLSLFYKKIWYGTDDFSYEIEKKLNYCKDRMFPSMWNQLKKQNWELKLEKGILNRKEIAANPYISIIINSKFPVSSINTVLNSIYRQPFIFFDVIVDEDMAEYVEKIYTDKENFNISKVPFEDIKGEYFMFMDIAALISDKTLKSMVTILKKDSIAQCVEAVYKNKDGNIELIDSSLSNKLFRSRLSSIDDLYNANVITRKTDVFLIKAN